MRLCPLCALASSWGVAQSLAFRGCLINNRGKQESWHVGLLVFLPHEVCPPQRLESSSLLGLRHPCPHGESMKQVLRRGGLPAGRQPHFYHLGSVSLPWGTYLLPGHGKDQDYQGLHLIVGQPSHKDIGLLTYF